MGTFHTLLMAHDFSADSDAALDLAVDLAKDVGADLHVVHVLHRPVEALSPYEIPLPPSLIDEVQAAARRRLEDVAAKAGEAGAPVRAHVRDGSPAEQIESLAREIGADLIVMGTRGLTGLPHVLLGSVAERTVRIASCPVLTVKAAPPDSES
jgi:nucleotide-binding universal stress UspA family protein